MTVNRKADSAREAKIIRRITFAAFVLNLALALVKSLIAVRSASVAVTASVIDSLSDSVASLAVLGGVLLSSRKSKRFPFGMYKIENLISVVIAIFIFIAGYEIGRTMVLGGNAARPDITLSAVVILALSAVAVFAFGRLAAYQGERTGSPTLKAEGKHRKIDALSSVVVLSSALLSFFGVELSVTWISFDRIAAAIIIKGKAIDV